MTDKTTPKRTRKPGAGRKPRGDSAADHVVRVRVTDAELETLEARREPGETMSDLLRRLLALSPFIR